MTKNIESALADMLEGLSVSDGYYRLTIGRVGAVKMAERIVKNEPDLLDALGAVSTADMAREIAEAQREANRWQTAAEENERWADEWKRKAEESEANASAQIETTGKLRAERDEWKARAKVAEAAMGEVIRAVADHPDPCDAPGREFSTCGWKRAFQQVHAIVHPAPAFTLPTELPARIEAKRVHHGYTTVLTLFTDGTGDRFWRAEYNGEDWKDAGVMECFTDHRLIGADQ